MGGGLPPAACCAESHQARPLARLSVRSSAGQCPLFGEGEGTPAGDDGWIQHRSGQWHMATSFSDTQLTKVHVHVKRIAVFYTATNQRPTPAASTVVRKTNAKKLKI